MKKAELEKELAKAERHVKMLQGDIASLESDLASALAGTQARGLNETLWSLAPEIAAHAEDAQDMRYAKLLRLIQAVAAPER